MHSPGIPCGRLETVDFPALSAVGGEVSLRWSPVLQSASGLGALTEVGGDLSFYYDSGLEDLGLTSLTSVGGRVNIYSNAVLCSAQVDALVAQLTSGPTLVNSSDNSGACP